MKYILQAKDYGYLPFAAPLCYLIVSAGLL